MRNNGGTTANQPAIGLSWVSVLKSSSKQPIEPSPTACRLGKPRHSLEVDENGFRVLKKTLQKQVTSQPHGVSLTAKPNSDKVISPEEQLGVHENSTPTLMDPHTLVLGQIDVDLRATLAAIQTNNSFAALTPSVERENEVTVENVTGINELGAFPIHAND
ncbi:unnamed protein product [Amaranthus hypochondriacus]